MSNELSAPQVLVIAALVGLCGGITLILLSIGLGPRSVEPWWCIPSALGAGLGGAAVYPAFGHPGATGWVWSMFGMVMATLIGSAVTILLLGFFDIVLHAPLFVLALIVQNEVTLVVWLTFTASIHLLVRYWRVSSAA